MPHSKPRASTFACVLLVIASAPLLSQARAQRLATGYVYERPSNRVIGPYAVIASPSSRRGYYIRVWSGSGRVFSLGFSRQENVWLYLTGLVYDTGGRHWTLRGGQDRPRQWRRQSAEEFALDTRSNWPRNGIAPITSRISGFVRTTYVPQGSRWRQVRRSWRGVMFVPTWVNNAGVRAWMQALRQRPRPPRPWPTPTPLPTHQPTRQPTRQPIRRPTRRPTPTPQGGGSGSTRGVCILGTESGTVDTSNGR